MDFIAGTIKFGTYYILIYIYQLFRQQTSSEEQATYLKDHRNNFENPKLADELFNANQAMEGQNENLVQCKEENEKMRSLVRQLEEKCSNLEFDLKNVNSDLDLSKEVEEELKKQLTDTQEVCDQLVSRMQKVQEEKAELIMAQQSKEADLKQDEVHEIKESLNKVQAENLALRTKLQEEKVKGEQEISSRIYEIEMLRRKLDEAQKSESDIRRSLNDAQLAGEELIKRVQIIQTEKFDILEKSKTKKEDLINALADQKEVLHRSEEERGNLQMDNIKLREDVASLQESNENQMEMILANNATIADLQHSLQQSEKENAELSSNVERMQKDMDSAAAKKIKTLKEEIGVLKDELQQAIKKAECNERFVTNKFAVFVFCLVLDQSNCNLQAKGMRLICW